MFHQNSYFSRSYRKNFFFKIGKFSNPLTRHKKFHCTIPALQLRDNHMYYNCINSMYRLSPYLWACVKRWINRCRNKVQKNDPNQIYCQLSTTWISSHVALRGSFLRKKERVWIELTTGLTLYREIKAMKKQAVMSKTDNRSELVTWWGR